MTSNTSFDAREFDIEHALGMYAESYAILPASGIYEREMIRDQLAGIPDRSHIYIIGETPKLKFISFEQIKRTLRITVEIGTETRVATFPIPDDFNLKEEGSFFFLEGKDGQRCIPRVDQVMHAAGNVPFEVFYIGQAFGKNGERKAIDRLLSHSTLQKIALKGPKDGHELSLVLLELADTMVVTQLNPLATERSDEVAEVRIGNGLEKLYGTSLAERVSLYEAGLIRYFKPKYNVEFKDSFPSTNLKILSDCYEKDFAAVVSEICLDNFPYSFYSDVVEPKPFHIAAYDLQKDDNRKFFFGFEE